MTCNKVFGFFMVLVLVLSKDQRKEIRLSAVRLVTLT